MALGAHTAGEVRLKNTEIKSDPWKINDKRLMPRCRAEDGKRTKIIIQSGKKINRDTKEKILRKGGQRKRDERHYW